MTLEVPSLYWTPARIVGQSDGDTFDVIRDLGDNLAQGPVRIRLCAVGVGVNTPETKGAERPLGLQAKAVAADWVEATEGIGHPRWPFALLLAGPPDKCRDSFGRLLAAIDRADGDRVTTDLGHHLLAAGQAETWPATLARRKAGLEFGQYPAGVTASLGDPAKAPKQGAA